MWIYFLGLVLRLIYLYQISDNPFFEQLNNDPLTYDTQARKIASGDWIGDQIFFKAPFYPYFLAVFYRLFDHSYLLPRLFQTIIGSFSCIQVYAIARHSFGRETAEYAALITATYGMLIYFENELLITGFMIFFSLSAIRLWQKAALRDVWSLWLASGIVCGLAALCRPNILLFCPLIPIWLWLQWSDSKQSARRVRILKATLYTAIGVCTAVLPVTIRNYLVGNDFVLISSQGGIAFQAGNNPDSDGAFAVPSHADQIGGGFWEEHCAYISEQDAGRPLKPSEISRYWFGLGKNFILSRPLDALKLYLKKTHLFLHGHELGNNQDIYFFRQYGPIQHILIFRFCWLIPFALIGIGLVTRSTSRRTGYRGKMRKNSLLLLFFIGAYSISVILFFVSARHRMPVVILLIIFAAYAMTRLRRLIRRSNAGHIKQKWIRFGLIYLILLALLNYPFYDAFARNEAQEHFNLSAAYYRTGDPELLDLAEVELQKTLSINSAFPRAQLNLGVILMDRTDPHDDRAESYFLGELAINPNDEMAHNNLGVLFERRGDSAQAKSYFQTAISIRPTYREAYLNLARVQDQIADYESAYETYVHAIALTGEDAEMCFLASHAAFLVGLIDQSEKWIKIALELDEKNAVYWHQRALVENARQNRQAALYFLRKAVELAPERSELHHDIGVWYMQNNRLEDAKISFQKSLGLDSDTARAYHNLGLIALAESDTSRAVSYFHHACALDSTFQEAREAMKSANLQN